MVAVIFHVDLNGNVEVRITGTVRIKYNNEELLSMNQLIDYNEAKHIQQIAAHIYLSNELSKDLRMAILDYDDLMQHKSSDSGEKISYLKGKKKALKAELKLCQVAWDINHRYPSKCLSSKKVKRAWVVAVAETKHHDGLIEQGERSSTERARSNCKLTQAIKVEHVRAL